MNNLNELMKKELDSFTSPADSENIKNRYLAYNRRIKRVKITLTTFCIILVAFLSIDLCADRIMVGYHSQVLSLLGLNSEDNAIVNNTESTGNTVTESTAKIKSDNHSIKVSSENKQEKRTNQEENTVPLQMQINTTEPTEIVNTIPESTKPEIYDNKTEPTQKVEQNTVYKAVEAVCGDWKYVILEDNTAYVYEYTGKDKELTIPSSLDGHQVIGIAYMAFLNNENITKLVISEGVKTICDYAFDGCKSLTTVTLPETLTDIGNSTFANCVKLTSINLPEALKNIGSFTFENCEKLTSIDLPKGLTQIGAATFSNCVNLSSITLPEGLTNIGGAAFSGCKKISKIKLPNSLNYIGSFAFSNTSITSAEIPKNVIGLGGGLFLGNRKFTTLKINKSIMYIDDTALADSDYYVLMGYGDTAAYLSAFHNRNKFISLGKASAPKKETFTSGDYKYQLKDNGTAIIVDYIGNKTKLVIPSTVGGHKVVSVGNGATFSSNDIKKLVIPEGVKTIDDFAFCGFKSLSEVSLPKSLVSVGKGAFRQTILTNITIPDNVENIGMEAFGFNNRLRKVRIGKSIKVIDEYAFDNKIASVIYGYGDTVAYTYAKDNSITFVNLGNAVVHSTKPKTVKKANTLTVKAKKITVNAKAVKNKKVTKKSLTISKAKGKVSVVISKITKSGKKVSAKVAKKFKLNSKGYLTIGKGTKKGKYKITAKITAKGNSNYKPKTVTKTITVKIK